MSRGRQKGWNLQVTKFTSYGEKSMGEREEYSQGWGSGSHTTSRLPLPPFGAPGATVVIRAACLSCQSTRKAQKFVPLWDFIRRFTDKIKGRRPFFPNATAPGA